MNNAERQLLSKQSELSANLIATLVNSGRIRNPKCDWSHINANAKCVTMRFENAEWMAVAYALKMLFSGLCREESITVGRSVKTAVGYGAHAVTQRYPSLSAAARVEVFASQERKDQTILRFYP